MDTMLPRPTPTPSRDCWPQAPWLPVFHSPYHPSAKMEERLLFVLVPFLLFPPFPAQFVVLIR